MCAIVGVINSLNSASVAYYSLFSMQHRGQEASGISFCDKDSIRTIKSTGLVTEVFSNDVLPELRGDIAIGHNRYATSGKSVNNDAQPIFGNSSLGELSIVHNGNLINKDEIRDELIQEGAIFLTQMDTENILHLISKSKKENLEDRIREAVKRIKGAFNLIIMSKDKMFVIRDNYGIRPFSLGRLKDGGYIVASESCAFDLVGASFIRDVEPGEMLVFTKGQEEFETIKLFDEIQRKICAFEFVYFARPDSIIEGKSVYEVRKNLGKKLAQVSPKIDADFVVPVPDSGMPAALGYSQESKIPFEIAIVRNHYVGRTFIEPTQNIRNLKVKLKLNPISSLLKDKKIIVIDDSIVRGTTSKKIVELLRHAGAKEIHMRIACPEIKFPERYGIDTPSYEELISVRMNKEEIRDYIGADSLEFLDIDSFVDSLGRQREYSLVSFDGDYFVK